MKWALSWLVFSSGLLLATPSTDSLDEDCEGFEQISPSVEISTDGGGHLSAWMDPSGRPRKITLWVVLSNRELRQTFYYDNSNIVRISVFERWFELDQESGKPMPELTSRTKETSYSGDKPAGETPESNELRAKAVETGNRLFQAVRLRPAKLDLNELLHKK